MKPIQKLAFFLLIVTSIFSCENKSMQNSGLFTNQIGINNAADNQFVHTALTQPPQQDSLGEQIEIVFCLDATGSMSGLIKTAKEKIWSIVSELAQKETLADIKLGMVFYRDRGDYFVTKSIPLTTDLDSVYSELLIIEAAGGGDTPESVNQALYESVSEMQWNLDKKVYKTIFVVGDCPPHMDYQDDVSYLESCKIAAKKGIIINTIKLGNACGDAIPHFKKMAECSNGVFLQLDQEANDIVITTPYDKEINALSIEIDKSRMYYGSADIQRYNNLKKNKALDLYDEGTVAGNTDRASFKNSAAGRKNMMGYNEIVQDYENNKVNLDSLSNDELPAELKNKTIEEQKEILNQAITTRKQNQAKITELSKKRQEFITKEKKSHGEESSFSKEVVEIMTEQAKSK